MSEPKQYNIVWQVRVDKMKVIWYEPTKMIILKNSSFNSSKQNNKYTYKVIHLDYANGSGNYTDTCTCHRHYVRRL